MTQAQPLIETLPMTLGTPMSDEPGNPSSIEMPLQIELPNGQTLYAAVALGGFPFYGQQQIAERMATAWNAFAGVPTQNIKSPVQCLHQIAESADNRVASTSEGDYLEGVHIPRLREALTFLGSESGVGEGEVGANLSTYVNSIVRGVLRCKELLRSQPQAVQPAVPDAWAAVHFGGKRNGKIYNTCDTEKECNDYIEMIHQQSDSTTLTAKPVFFAAAPAHPAEGMPAPNENAAFEAWARGQFFVPEKTLPTSQCYNNSSVQDMWEAWKARAALAATHPAAQGLDAKDCDMFWVADDPDQNHDTLHDAVVRAYEDGGLQTDCTVEIQCAKCIGNVVARITSTDPLAFELLIDAELTAQAYQGTEMKVSVE